jgi:Domain of unknown function (DUF5659)
LAITGPITIPQREKETTMIKAEERLFTTLDIYHAAFLSLNRIPPTLELRNGRVVFTFPASDKLYKLTMNFNSNVNVPVADFVTMIKTLRGQMLSMRGKRE